MKETLEQALEALEGLLNKTSGQAIYSFMETERRIAMSACVGLRQAIAEAEKQEPVEKMTAHRAMYFMERFKREEKLLGPNEQAAVDFVIAMLNNHPQPKQEHGKQDNYQGSDAAKAAHMMDLYTALGVRWGDDPFAVIAKMRSIAEAEKQERPTGPATSADRYFYEAGFEAGRQQGMKQEQGEPVAWFRNEDIFGNQEMEPVFYATKAWDNCQPLYTTPQQRKPLTDEQAEFESVFKLPANCTKFEGGYAPTSYNAWDAQTFCARWEGWKARAAHGIKGQP